ncbi:Pet127-domain-containing protein [Hypomontagnella submonticulosa]|nr:Pet127-domain-containing protein [Hypomontagnella submonticulosa]
MLQLSGRSAQRIGTSYICASCLVASQSIRPSTLRPALTTPGSYHGRPLSTTSSRAAPATEPDSNSSTSNTAGDEDIKPPLRKKSPKKKVKTTTTNAKGERQLQFLQGALQALKNVLAAQNINVDHKGKPSSGQKSKPQAKAKTKVTKAEVEAKAKPEPKTKPSTKPKSKSTNKPTRAIHARSKEKVVKGKVLPQRSTARSRSEKTKSTEGTSPSSRLPVRRVLSKRGGSEVAPRNALRELGSIEIGGSSPNSTDSHSISNVLTGDYHIIGKPFTGETPPPRVYALKAKEKALKSQENEPLVINSLSSSKLNITPIETAHSPVPSLSYGLDRVLFNPGVYYLQEPRSRVYNFDPYLSEIMPIQEFDFNALKQYVTSSKDSTLIGIAKEHGRRYTGSTSSMTSMLSHFHYLLSSWREINTSMLSRGFIPESVQFTRIMRGPAAVFLHWKDGTYAIDADKEYDTANILSMLGKSMEKLLTLSKEEYEKYRHTNSDQITEEERNADEAFHYTKFGDFMLRSQLDAYDPRVPGSGMFDLKTRAVVSIRMDAKGFQKGLGYEIRDRFGQWNSFEREYYDMIRSAFLKYSLQVRMGRMDGIFVAFHNTQRIFGFQYISLNEMDFAIHGTTNLTLGHREYKLSLALLNDILDRATKRFPEQSLRLHFETRTSVGAPFMYIFAKPVSQTEIEDVQSAGKDSIEAFEKDILGIVKDAAEAESESITENDDVLDEEEEIPELSVAQEMSSVAAWKEVRRVVEDAMDDDEVGVGAVREAIEDALEQSGLLHARSSIEARSYVDALLGAVTSSEPSEPAYSLSATQVEDDTITDEQEDNELMDEQDIESPEIMDSAQHLEGKAEVLLDDSLLEQSPIVETRIEEKSSGSTELTTGQPSQEDNGEDQNKSHESNAHISISPQNGQRNVETRPNDLASVDEVASQAQANINTSREIEEDDEVDEVDETDDELEHGESKRGLTVTSTMSPLKALIVKMAQRIDDERSFAEGAERPIDDPSKLKEFERILGELIARSKDGQTRPPTNDRDPTPDTETDLESQDEINPVEPEVSEVPEVKEIDGTLESSAQTPPGTETPAEETEDSGLLGMVLTIKNKVNGKYVYRPEDITKHDKWDVEYNVEELSSKRAQTIYRQCKERRRKTFDNATDRDSEWYKMFRGSLDKHTQSGRKFRARETENAKKYPVHILGQQPLQWEDVFGKQK